jgi:ectoine hydroxylase-related dioxygenase (phytanoyl-CoA dioxygenase family)
VVPNTQNRAPGTPINQEEDEKNAIYLEAPVGSLIAFNGGIIHAGSANTTSSIRRCMHAYYSRSWCRSQWDFVLSFPEEIKATLSREQKQIFGFNCHEQVYDLSTHETRRS